MISVVGYRLMLAIVAVAIGACSLVLLVKPAPEPTDAAEPTGVAEPPDAAEPAASEPANASESAEPPNLTGLGELADATA